jgi:hypothetical protein
MPVGREVMLAMAGTIALIGVITIMDGPITTVGIVGDGGHILVLEPAIGISDFR